MGSYGVEYAGYIDPTDTSAKNIVQFFDDFYQRNYPVNIAYQTQASIDKRFKVGDQSMWQMIYGDNQFFQARRFFFNLIRRHIEMMGGYQRRNRKSSVALPLQGDTDELADDFTKVLKWDEDRDNFQETFSTSFENCLDVGVDWLWLYADYTQDPLNGQLCTDSVSYNNVIFDSFFRKQDMSDCEGVQRRRWISQARAEGLFPEFAKEIKKFRPQSQKDSKFPLQAEVIIGKNNNLLSLDEFHYMSTRKAHMIIDPKTGESVEWEQEDDDDKDLMKRTLAMQPWLIHKTMDVPTVKLGILLNGKAIYDGPNNLGVDFYPCVPNLCYWEPDMPNLVWRLQGKVRNLRDVNYLYNMRKVIEMDILQSQINSGWIYKVDKITDPKAFRQSGQGFVIPVKGEVEEPIDAVVKRIDAPGIPESMIHLSQLLSEDITKISGVNEELLGAATDDKAGVLSMLRQSAGLTTLNGIFDRADFAQRCFAKVRLAAITKMYTKAKVRQILGKDPHPDFFTSKALRYSIAVEEGAYTTTQRQMELKQLLYFKEIGIQGLDNRIIEVATITNKKQLKEEMAQANQMQQQMAEREAQKEEQKSNSEVMDRLSSAKLKQAQTAAEYAKISETQASAEQKKQAADYELVKTMIELETLDLEQVKSSFELAQSIKMFNTGNQPPIG